MQESGFEESSHQRARPYSPSILAARRVSSSAAFGSDGAASSRPDFRSVNWRRTGVGTVTASNFTASLANRERASSEAWLARAATASVSVVM